MPRKHAVQEPPYEDYKAPKMIFEIFEEVQAAKKDEDRIVQILQTNKSVALIDVLRGAFDDSIVFELPPGVPQYTPDDAVVGHTRSNLLAKTRHFPKFVVGAAKHIKQHVKERMFIEILESIHHNDAAIVCAMKDKNLTKLYPALTKEVVKRAFPDSILK